MSEKEKHFNFAWQTVGTGNDTNVGITTPNCDTCPYNPFRDEPDSGYTENDGVSL